VKFSSNMVAFCWEAALLWWRDEQVVRDSRVITWNEGVVCLTVVEVIVVESNKLIADLK